MSGLTEALQRAPLPALLGALHWFEQSESMLGLKGLHCCFYTRALIFAGISSNLAIISCWLSFLVFKRLC